MFYEENSDNDNDPTINPASKAPSSASEANTSKLLGPDEEIAGADHVDDIEIDVTATANARKRVWRSYSCYRQMGSRCRT